VVKQLATPVSPDVQAVMQKLDEVLEAVRSKPSANVDQLEKEVDRLRRDVEELKKSLDKQR
jgi:peptidoglycan hydrolase CwlO-like protein